MGNYAYAARGSYCVVDNKGNEILSGHSESATLNTLELYALKDLFDYAKENGLKKFNIYVRVDSLIYQYVKRTKQKNITYVFDQYEASNTEIYYSKKLRKEKKENFNKINIDIFDIENNLEHYDIFRNCYRILKREEYLIDKEKQDKAKDTHSVKLGKNILKVKYVPYDESNHR